MEYMYACNTLHVVHVTSCMQLEYVHVHKCTVCACQHVQCTMCMYQRQSQSLYVHVHVNNMYILSVLINHNVISILFILQLLSLSIEKRQHKETV